MQCDFERNLPFDLERSLRAVRLRSGSIRRLCCSGLPFSLTLLTILLAHEFGHYLAAMYHRVDASLPYFLPSPLPGHLRRFHPRALADLFQAGAVRYRRRRAAGRLRVPAAGAFRGAGVFQGDSRHRAPGRACSSARRRCEWLLERLIFPGVPSADIYLHPVARAAWVGMFATALNLLPIGQLDGGHILYAFFPRRHRADLHGALPSLLLPLGYSSGSGWLLWGVVLLLLGRRHPVIYDDAELDARPPQAGLARPGGFPALFHLAPIAAGGL